MNRYVFKWKRNFFWRSRIVVGHNFAADQNKMILYYEDGGLEEIAFWTSCSIRLGKDWVDATRKEMEKKAGLSIPLNVKSI